jgi:membrane dipeptidase
MGDAPAPTETRQAARDLLTACLVWDNHGCMPVGWPHDQSFLPQLERYRAVGVHAVMLNIGFGEMSIEDHLRTLASLRHWLKARPEQYILLNQPDDAKRARATGRLAVGFDIEGANAIGDQINLIELYYDLGVRWMLLAYNRNNRTGGGCQDDDSGLTEFGRLVIREMERVGMQVCVSHTGHRTVRDVFEIATKPVIFSHSNPSALHAHPRNIPDDLIKACAASGGIVGVNGVGIFLGKNDSTSATYARHIDHIVQLVGPRHASLALDYVFDMHQVEEYLSRMQQTFPPGLGYELGARFVAPEQLEEIVATLQRWGYQENDLTAILGGNWLRLAHEVWKRPELTKSAT